MVVAQQNNRPLTVFRIMPEAACARTKAVFLEPTHVPRYIQPTLKLRYPLTLPARLSFSEVGSVSVGNVSKGRDERLWYNARP